MSFTHCDLCGQPWSGHLTTCGTAAPPAPPAPRMSGEEFERIGKSEWTLSREDATALWREARRAREEAANLAEADRIAMMELMRRADALAAKDAEIERLKGQYESSHASRLHAEKCLERAEAELKESEADVDRRREWIEKLNDENDELKAEIETLQSLKLDADDHYYNEKARREKAEAERDRARGEAAASAVLLDQAREDVARLRAGLEKIAEDEHLVDHVPEDACACAARIAREALERKP